MLDVRRAHPLIVSEPRSMRQVEKPMIYELRTYHCLPGRLPALLKRFETVTLPLFEKHGIKQLGFWTVGVGESNQDLIYILQWESMSDRDAKFGSFQRDPDWIEARRKSEVDGLIVASIANSILLPTAFSAAR
jgi:NIPSNAP